jgi:galactose oxidase-like protein/Big-like domain-containing protein
MTHQTVGSVTYTAPQTAGNTNVVIVGWNDSTAHVTSVTDSNNNAYQLAVGPTVLTGSASQAIYFATNIAGAASSANTVTVTFDTPPNVLDLRILEYSGIDPTNPIDVVGSGTGTTTSTGIYGTTSDVGVVTATNTLDLVVAANTVQSATSGPDAPFTKRILTSSGNIVEDQVATAPGFCSAGAPLSTPGYWVMQLVAFRALNSPPTDTTSPTVSITPPTGGTGTITVAVNASDTGSGVAAVQLQVDGVPFGTPSTTSPYKFSLNTAQFANGVHSLTASAWDYANNRGDASPVSVSFSNSSPGNPAQSGLWSGTISLPIVSTASALLPNGKILMWDGQSSGNVVLVWNPNTTAVDWVPAPTNRFCSALEQMGNGRILSIGGHMTDHIGLVSANVFDPMSESWAVLADMAIPRWYPTVTALPDGRFIATSGETNCDDCETDINEIYDPSAKSWNQLTSAPFLFPYYPHAYVLPDGRMLVAGTTEAPIVSQVLDLTIPVWTSVGGAAVDGGSSAMYLPGKILKMGSSADIENASQPSLGTAYVLDMTVASPAWVQVGSMSFIRSFHSATLLPDGNVLVTGGGADTAPADLANAVLPAEVWSPATGAWTTLAAMHAPRLYHSGALLLPDARVLILGGGRFGDTNASTDQRSAEFFAPPYLFKGSRPAIISAPSQLSYGQTFNVQTPDATRIAKVSLIRFGAATHSDNMSQRYLPLSFTMGANALTVTAPANSNLAPPGNYMLFLVDSNGIPSVAAIVHF